MCRTLATSEKKIIEKSGALSIFGFNVRRGLNETKLRISNGQKWSGVRFWILLWGGGVARKHAVRKWERDSHLICFICVNSFSIHPLLPTLAPNDWLNLFKMTSIYNWMRVREQRKCYVCVRVYVYIYTTILSDRFIEIRAGRFVFTFPPFRTYDLFLPSVFLPIILFTSRSMCWCVCCIDPFWIHRSHTIREVSIENEWNEGGKKLHQIDICQTWCVSFVKIIINHYNVENMLTSPALRLTIG